MLDQIAIFLSLLLLWIGFRFLFRRWLWRSMANGRITMKSAVVLHAASFAIVPLLALPFVPWAWMILLVASITLFAFSIALSRLAITTDGSNLPPS